ncbi:hypothetical protein F8M41_003556 [Gigaspora margarita]|uniref:Uncharacterized protein n=1 Tax=Gigaspora margarita TaxID=4874 RepID=A0A8H4ES43_GIGMA|nr:hypothetical protein F8M41_003556 [Gigaspora margarita]
MNNNFDFTNEKTFKELLEKIRALRGTLTTKIKSSTFFIFGTLLEQINYRASPERGSEENVVYAIAIAQAMLNLKYEKITMSDTAINHKIAKNLDILKYNMGFSLSSFEDETEKEKSNEESDNVKKEPVRKCKINRRISARHIKAKKTSEEEQEDQEDSPEDLKEAEQEPKIMILIMSKKSQLEKIKIFQRNSARPRVETSEIEWEDQDELSEDSNQAENEPENNDSRASSSSSSDDDNNSKKETNDDSKKETDESDK